MNTKELRLMAKKVGHYAFARWAQKQGISLSYTYYIVFGKRNNHANYY